MIIDIAFWTFLALFVGLLLYAFVRFHRELNAAARKRPAATSGGRGKLEAKTAAESFLDNHLESVRARPIHWVIVICLLIGIGAIGWLFT